MTDAKAQLKALTRSGLAFDGLVLDTLVAGWLLRPILQEKSLADLVAFHLGETVPQSDPSMLVPEEGADAGAPEYAWYTLRLAPVVLARALRELPPAARRDRDAARAGARRAWSCAASPSTTPSWRSSRGELGAARGRTRRSRRTPRSAAR